MAIRSRFFQAHHDPALNRKLVALRVVFLIAAAGFAAVMIGAALDGELPSISSDRRRAPSARVIAWRATPVSFVVTFLLNTGVGLAAIGFCYALVDRFVTRRHGRPPRFFRKRYPH